MWNVGITVSKQIRQVLGGQRFSGLAFDFGAEFGAEAGVGFGPLVSAGLGFKFALYSGSEDSWCSSPKPPGIDEPVQISGLDELVGISCGQCHCGLELKPVGAMAILEDEDLNNVKDDFIQLLILSLFAAKAL